MLIRALGLTLVVLACAVGCKKAAEKAMEAAIESQMAKDGGTADVDISGEKGSFHFEDKKSGSKMAIGSDTEIPKDFPPDVPVYPSLKLLTAFSQQENSMFMLQGTSPDAVAKVAAFYAEETPKQGWSEESNMDQGDQMRAVVYTKEGRSLNVMLAATDEGTSVSISTSQEKP